MKPATRITATLLMALTVSACAQSPEAIAPVSMGRAYDGINCREAARLLAQERQVLTQLEAVQRSAVAGDAVGVFLVGVPVSSLTGSNKAGEIAASKGKVLALESRLLTCRT